MRAIIYILYIFIWLLPVRPANIRHAATSNPSRDSDQGLDALGRLTQIVGGLSGAYVGLRGSCLWCLLFLLGIGLYVLHAAVGYFLGGL